MSAHVNRVAPLSSPARTGTVVVGTSVGHYHVLARLGEGGMGVVYEAEDLRLARRVALKFLPDSLARDPQSLLRFEREARMASALNHPNICTIYDIGTLRHSPYIVMELLEGETLRNRIAAGPLPLDQFLQVAVPIVSAVAAAHARQIVHRDLKPANIFITSGGLVKILDFGLAKPVHEADDEATSVAPPPDEGTPSVDEPALVTLPGTVLGTTAYMSPEQVSGRRVDPRTDVFALGVIFYEALAGSRPFAGVDIEDVRQQILHKAPLPLIDIDRRIPPEVDGFVRRCLEKGTAERFASAIELQPDLTAFARRWGAGATASETAPAHPWRSQRIDSLAVLPFEAARSDPDSEYLGDGICEDLIRDLARLPAIRVKSRSLVQRYRGQSVTPAAVGRDLGVTAVVMGTVAKRGDRLSVIVEFVRCEDESLLWSERITRSADDLLAIEDELLRHLVKEISARVGDGGAFEPVRRHTPNADAHRLYLRGRASWNQRTPESLRRAIELFQQAVEADPEYGLAFAGLADAYTALSFYDLVPPADVMPRAKAAATRALETDPDLPEGHASLGLVSSIWDFNWDESGRRLRKALDLNASLAYVHHWYAMQLSTLGRGDEAYAEIRRSLELDPLSTAARADALNVLIRAGRFDEGIREARRATALDPSWASGWAALGRALQYSGAAADALEAFERAVVLSPDSPRLRALLAAAYGAAGRLDDAHRVARDLALVAGTRYVPAFWRAVIALGLGDTETTLGLLEQAFAERYPQIAYLAVEPAFAPLWSHARVVRLAEQIGIDHVMAGQRRTGVGY